MTPVVNILIASWVFLQFYRLWTGTQTFYEGLKGLSIDDTNETVTFRFTAEASAKFSMKSSDLVGWGWSGRGGEKAKTEVHTKCLSLG